MPTTTVSLHLLQGRNLAVKDAVSSDPFVRIFVNGEDKFQSRCKSKTVDPKFNEKFHFDVSDDTAEVVLKVYDDDAMHGEDFMGVVTIPLKGTEQNGGVPEGAVWYPVEKGTGDEQCPDAQGELSVKITMTKVEE